MSVISRFTEIMSANINSALEKAENKNADKLLENYLRECQLTLRNIKAEAAGYMANEKAAKRHLNECLDTAAKYKKYAESAMEKGNEGDARRFLEAKAEAEQGKAKLEAEAALATENSQKMMAMAEKLEVDIRETEVKIRDLTLQLENTKLTEKENDAGGYGGRTNTLNDLCDKVTQRIDTADATATLNGGTDSDLADLEKQYAEEDVTAAAPQASVEDELEAMRKALAEKKEQ